MFVFDPDLNFKYYISSIRKKLSKSLYALRTVKNTLNQSLFLLYNSICHCHLLYAVHCVHIWSCSNSGPINKIFKLQKAAVRIVSGASYNSHTEPLFKKLEILTLPDLITFAKIQIMQSFVQRLHPSSFNDTWAFYSIRIIGENEIQLRNHLQIQNQHSNLAKLDIFPLYNFPKLWQLFPDEQIKFVRKTCWICQKTQTVFHQWSFRHCRLRSTIMSRQHGRPFFSFLNFQNWVSLTFPSSSFSYSDPRPGLCAGRCPFSRSFFLSWNSSYECVLS